MKAEDRALEAYPIVMSQYSDNCKEYDSNESDRLIFIEGYHQAEKDLIDKAVGWIEEINNHHHIMRYSDSCEPPISELTEWFKNYMKEGGKDE